MTRSATIFCLLTVLSRIGVGLTLEESLARQVIDRYQLDSTLVRITLVRSNLTCDDVSGFEVKTRPLTQSEPRGRFPMRVELFREGTPAGSGAVSLDIRIYADLPVPAQSIPRYQVLSSDMFEYKRFDVTSITEKILDDVSQMSGCRAKQNLVAGKWISATRIEKVPDVENGASVTIVGSGPLFDIRVRGMALQNGVIGEKIKVKNIDSRKIIVGTISAPGVVQVTL